jgi:soluble lytic murein transglycosylase
MNRRAIVASLTAVFGLLGQLAGEPSPPAASPALAETLALVQQRRLSEAVEALRRWSAAQDAAQLSPAWQQRLPFLMGYLLFHLGDYGKALLYLEQAREHYPALQDYVLWYVGQCLLRLERFAAARTALQGLIDAHPDSLHRPEALFFAAEASRRMGDLARAEELYRRYRREYPDGAHRGEVQLGLGLVYREMGRPDAALGEWRALWIEHPEDPAAAAVPALERTLPAGFPTPPVSAADLQRRAERLYRLHRHREALQAFALARDAAPDLALAADTLYQLGMAQYHARENAAALETFRQLYDSAPSGPLAAPALFMQARLHLRLEDDGAFVDTARALMTRFPARREADEIAYLMGHFYRNRGRTADALQAFRQVVERRKGSEFADDAWWYLGWLYYGAGDYGRAIQTWGQLVSAFPASPLVSDALYWQGRALERTQRRHEAWARYERLRTAYPQTYYGYLAEARLTGRAAWPWRAAAAELPANAFGSHAPPAELLPHGASPHSWRASELWAMRLFAEAGDELQAVAADDGLGARYRLQAALAYHWAGQHHQAMSLLRRYGKTRLGASAALLRLDLREVLYPLGALRQLDSTALDGLDPLLVGALIMAESEWNPRAMSRVGARGLMQVMPDTARRLAQHLGVDLASDEQLFEPTLNLTLGIAYLRQLLQRFDGSLPLVLASYNAGEDEVSKWWARRGSADAEEFIADMPFRETRRYVQRVLVYYAEYQRLYRGG